MSEAMKRARSRREFLKNAGRAAAAAAVATGAIPHVHAGEDNTIQLALIGCGGRGTGAVVDALSTKSGPIKLVSMADVFQRRLDGSYATLEKASGKQVDVPKERRFLGFDAYRLAMDCLSSGTTWSGRSPSRSPTRTSWSGTT